MLEELSSPDALVVAEREWIAAARRAWVPLTNATDGGDGSLGVKQTPEWIEKRIAAETAGRR